MGSIIRSAANNVGASGVFSSSAFNNASLNSVTSLPTAVDGKMKLILSTTASGNTTRSFTSGIDSTYRTYVFKFINIHPESSSQFLFQGSTQGASSTDGDYANTITSTYFVSRHDESGSNGTVGYDTGNDQAQGTSFQLLSDLFGNDNDTSLSGELWLFNPSSTTYVKHFMSDCQYHQSQVPRTNRTFMAGYFNTTSAINAIRFKMSTGNIDAGTIALYGIA